MKVRIAALAAAVVAVGVLAGPPARAQESPGDDEAPALAGYVGVAGGAAFSLRPVFPGLLPTGDAPFEVTLGMTSANTKSGGVSFAQAAGLWPGSAAANLGPLLAQAAGEPTFTQLFPPWPAGVQADQDTGEAVRGAEPGPLLKANAGAGGASSRAAGGGGGVPGLLSIDVVASTSRAVIDGLELVSESVVTLKGVSILDGVVTIDVLKNIATATSTGDDSESTGDVRVDGVKVNGMDVTVTGEGVKAAGPLAAAVATSLEAAGISMTLVPAGGAAADGTADRIASALLVTIENPAAAANPQFVGSRFEIALAPTAVGAMASPPFSEESVLDDVLDSGSGAGTFDTGALDAGSLGGVDVGSTDGSFSSVAGTVDDVFGDAGGAAGTGAAGTGGGGEELAFDRTGRTFEDVGGVPASLVVALVIGTALAARWIRRVVASIAGMEG